MSYIATATNKHFYYLDVRIEDIDIQDIATGLANECRFNGQIDNFYSVAQHSVYASYLVAPEFALEESRGETVTDGAGAVCLADCWRRRD